MGACRRSRPEVRGAGLKSYPKGSKNLNKEYVVQTTLEVRYMETQSPQFLSVLGPLRHDPTANHSVNRLNFLQSTVYLSPERKQTTFCHLPDMTARLMTPHWLSTGDLQKPAIDPPINVNTTSSTALHVSKETAKPLIEPTGPFVWVGQAS